MRATETGNAENGESRYTTNQIMREELKSSPWSDHPNIDECRLSYGVGVKVNGIDLTSVP